MDRRLESWLKQRFLSLVRDGKMPHTTGLVVNDWKVQKESIWRLDVWKACNGLAETEEHPLSQTRALMQPDQDESWA